jgi:RND family efflux transporter MFP subunit
MAPSPTLVALTLALAVGVCGCRQNQTDPAAAPAAPPPTDVTTIVLEPKPIPQSSEYVATVRSLRSITLQPEVEGFVRQILVKAGDRVAAGQPIIQIDPDRQQAAMTTTESQRAAREADLVFARQQLGRMKTLFEAGAVSRADLDRAEAEHNAAATQLTAVQSQLRENQGGLQYYRVTAPSAGIVGDIPIRQGDRVTPATVITTIDQAQGLEAHLSVPLERARELKPGLTVELVDGDGAVIASNPVTFIAPRADDATQSVLVTAALRQVPPGLRVMQYVRARLVWSNDPGLTVPVMAVNRIAGQYFVFVAEPAPQGTVARQKPVTLGAVVGNDYVVRAGLNAGDRVIVSNIQKIGDGAPVKPS